MAAAPEVQHTLAKSAGFSGTSLHTGEKVSLKLQPAPVDHGIKFKRKDLADEPTIDAKIDNLKMVERATTIGEGSMRVHTVEHVLSALFAMGVDNAIVEMDANEPPIGDGSAKPYVDVIKRAGVSAQEAPRKFFHVRERMHIETKTGSMLILLPNNDGFRVSCTQAGPDNRFTQFMSADIGPELFEREIAPARTFVYYEDVEPLMEKNLIRGGSLENAVVVRGDAVLSKEPLRFPDEFVRHKILDIIGDLALVGCRIRGHLIAVKPGHAANAELARAIAKELSRREALNTPRIVIKGTGGLDSDEIMQILPHRYPFLMVDRIISFDESGTKCVGMKSVTINEPFFQGHFPGHPVMPGVLQVEAMAQVASLLLFKLTKSSSRIGYFMSADEVKFRKPVMPGDTIFIHAELTKARGERLAKTKCHCVVNDAIVSEGELMFTFLDK
ncbi:MAG TPA: bifunctional UDP-3-O-[3-hydroxymyristoyl] N-acetylglucosamine deacetylase/3-hydroxyacyl-ACP dehydratase [Chthoniobacterales bacterium]|jgi:UDP-3-O-[3-hydroxymyristoyl] N-acetylglucosamine deacetylase/3-hydroxyacyl-[acyl-carrier-protein] dehydratase|nr:bifunctional UDP-3-O-[3-hydroxymyristoyl] N-acetylglucosamine deacetylase/3-hydroxyacyl-ACP dehydratase [Chthoniobacterales bacterium]